MEIKIEGNGAGKRIVFTETVGRKNVKRVTSVELDNSLIDVFYGIVTGTIVDVPQEEWHNILNQLPPDFPDNTEIIKPKGTQVII